LIVGDLLPTQQRLVRVTIALMSANATNSRNRIIGIALAVVVAAVVIFGFFSGSKDDRGTANTSASPKASYSKSTGKSNNGSGSNGSGNSNGAVAPAQSTSDLPVIKVTSLPPEAQKTLALVAAGGPYPYSKDGTVFGNRERVLPSEKNGFYREYTVVTPGSRDRGARRIVGGSNGSRFYTDDHYSSFSEVVSQ